MGLQKRLLWVTLATHSLFFPSKIIIPLLPKPHCNPPFGICFGVMSSATKNAANAVGGKTARACDSCITKRARWYCAADDAFLCQACDSLVHLANPLARRHERVRLKTASYKSTDEQQQPPTWHTKKPRTPRHGKHSRNNNPFHLVPEEGSEEANSHDENEEQLVYRVPIVDPFVAELCGTNSSPSSVTSTDQGVVAAAAAEVEYKGIQSNGFCCNSNEIENLHGMLPSDAELAEFAADVESLLGRGLENECVGMEELGLVDTKEEECSVGSGKVKVEEEESPLMEMEMEMDMGRDGQSFELSFDYETCEEVKEMKVSDLELGNELGEMKENDVDDFKRKKISLQLDYEAVIIAWASQKSPWTTADKPNLDPDECWHQCMGSCGTAFHHPYGELGGFGIHSVIVDGGREARVSRYREKRRTRLFSKKIRYEVRKLNAEKRPRMKGRFVKRASFAPPTFPLLNK